MTSCKKQQFFKPFHIRDLKKLKLRRDSKISKEWLFSLVLKVRDLGKWKWLIQAVGRFHMTSRRPYWCSKTVKRRPCWCSKQILLELNSSFFYVNAFFCSNKFANLVPRVLSLACVFWDSLYSSSEVNISKVDYYVYILATWVKTLFQ